MARRTNEALHMDRDIDESLWTSPIKEPPTRAFKHTNAHESGTKGNQNPPRSGMTTDDTHESKLRQELASVRKVNIAIEGILESLETAKNNMKNVDQTVGSASSLLDIWTRILSQTEHNQRLILDPSWHGASQDVADMEDEAIARQQAVERQEAEEQERRAAAAKKAEDEERRRNETSAIKPKPSVRGRVGIGRGSSAARSGYVATNTTSNTSTTNTSRGSNIRRTTSGTVRGTRGTSTRGRGS